MKTRVLVSIDLASDYKPEPADFEGSSVATLWIAPNIYISSDSPEALAKLSERLRATAMELSLRRAKATPAEKASPT